VTKPIDFQDLETTIAKTLRHIKVLHEARDRQAAAGRAYPSLSRYFSPNLVRRLANEILPGNAATSQLCSSALRAFPAHARTGILPAISLRKILAHDDERFRICGYANTGEPRFLERLAGLIRLSSSKIRFQVDYSSIKIPSTNWICGDFCVRSIHRSAA
jgi:hypothetical protein